MTRTKKIEVNPTDTSSTWTTMTSSRIDDGLKANLEEINKVNKNLEDFKSDYDVDQLYILKDIDLLYERSLKLELELNKYKSALLCTIIAVFLTMLLIVIVP